MSAIRRFPDAPLTPPPGTDNGGISPLYMSFIPCSSNSDRIREDLDVFDFALDAGEVAAINALRPRGLRICDFEFSLEWDRA